MRFVRTDLVNDGFLFDLLEFPQQDQPHHHVGRHDVQVSEEVGQQPGYVRERIPVPVAGSGATEQEAAPVVPTVLVRPKDFPKTRHRQRLKTEIDNGGE